MIIARNESVVQYQVLDELTQVGTTPGPSMHGVVVSARIRVNLTVDACLIVIQTTPSLGSGYHPFVDNDVRLC
jgi:hypothetical protein